MDHAAFYARLAEGGQPRTSQLTPYDYEQALADGEEAVLITVSSKLSGCYQNAVSIAEAHPGVYAVDSLTASCGMYALVQQAVRLRDEGCGAQTIAEQLLALRERLHVVAMLDTLEYLRRGGRLSNTAAFIGGLLGVKPVLGTQEGQLVALGKARGSKNAANLLIERVQKSGGIDFSLPLCLGYSGQDDTLLRRTIADNAALYRDHCEADALPVTSVGCAIGAHAGPGAILLGYFAKPNT